MRKVEVRLLNSDYILDVDRYPNKCGNCDANIDPKYIDGAFIRPHKDDKRYLELVFQCTNIDCNGLLIGYYETGDFMHYYYKKTKPTTPVDKHFEEEIQEVSENFVQIYNQAYYAEQNELDLISGIGYRKALEFLVKDYLIYLSPDDTDEILKKQLTPCINMLDNHNIKEIARRASWLGNDEAHYMRKWEDKDINDLKKLIEVTVYFIAMDVSAKKYLEEME